MHASLIFHWEREDKHEMMQFFKFLYTCSVSPGHAVAQLVDALRYKSEGRGFDSRWRHNPSGRTMALGLTQSLIGMNTRNIS